MRSLAIPLVCGALLCRAGAASGQSSLGIAPLPILYSEADARAAICYAATLPGVGPKLRAVPRPRVIIDGRIAQAVDSTLTRCRAKETPPEWLDTVDYLADATAYGRYATHGIVRIQSFTFTAFVKRYTAEQAARAEKAKHRR